MTRSVRTRLAKLEAASPSRDSDPDCVMIGELSVTKIFELLLSEERAELHDAFPKQDGAWVPEQISIFEKLIALAHERQAKGQVIRRVRRSVGECYAEMKLRQAKGERICYGDVSSVEEWLENGHVISLDAQRHGDPQPRGKPRKKPSGLGK
jgi:hypothetical protein